MTIPALHPPPHLGGEHPGALEPHPARESLCAPQQRLLHELGLEGPRRPVLRLLRRVSGPQLREERLLLAELAAQALGLGSLGGEGTAFGVGLVLQREVTLHLQPQQLVELNPDRVLALRVLPRLVEVPPQQRQRVRCQLQLLLRDRPLLLYRGLGLRRLGGQLLVLRPGVRELVLQPVRVVDIRLHQHAAVIRGGARRVGSRAWLLHLFCLERSTSHSRL